MEIEITNLKPWSKLRRKVGKAISEYQMISEGDRVLIGVSGGKDSMILLKILAELQRRSPVKFELIAVTFNPNFSEFDINLIQDWAEHCQVPHHVCGVDIPQILESKECTERPCVLCSRLRRGHLYRTAKELNCNKLVLGQHLDDIAVSLLIGLFRGQGLTTMGPNVPADGEELRLIRPFAMTPQSDIIAAAETLPFKFEERCPYAQELKASGDRAFFEQMLKDLSQKIPAVREQMLKSMSDVRPAYLLDKKFLDLK